MIEGHALAIGTRVRLRSASHAVRLRADTGHIVGFDTYDSLPVVLLDVPAVYHAADGSTRDLPQLVESEDNLEIVG